jgi:heme exporter protein B
MIATLIGAWSALLGRDITLALKAGGAGFMALAFFAAVLTLVPLGIGPEPALLARIAAGMIWVAAALASLLSLERLFQADEEDGSLDLIWLSPLGGIPIVIAKCAAQWLTAGLPIVIAAPLFGLMLRLPPEGYGPLVLGLLAGTPAFFLIGALGAALALGVRRGGLLIALIVLPLYVPFLIFGVSTVEAALTGISFWPSFYFLLAGTLIATVLFPLATAAALRLHLS